MKPPFAWYGGKTRLAPTIAGLLPPHRVYIEPFAGSCAVLFAKQPSDCEVINDLDGSVVNFFRVVRDRPEALERACRLSPYSRAEWRNCAEMDCPDADSVERARRFWVRVTQSFAAKTGSGWSCSTSRSPPASVSAIGAVARFEEVAARLRRVAIEQCDAVACIERLARPDAVIYLDPPYVMSTRSVLGKRPAGDYLHELTDADHRRLAAAVHNTPATVVLSGYPSPLYDELYAEWHHIDFRAFAAVGARKGAPLGLRTERLWSNRPFTIGSLFDPVRSDNNG